MYLGCPDRWAELARRAMLYDGLAADVKLAMLRRAAHNDLRGVARPDADHRRAMSAIFGRDGMLPETVGLVRDPAVLVTLSHRLRRASDPAARWDMLETTAKEVFAAVLRPDRWRYSVALNVVLARSGHIPVAGYAFGSWHPRDDRAPDRDQLFALVELATCYLFRLSAGPACGTRPRGRLVGHGAYSTVYRRGDMAVKVGRNLAARDFALEQEALLLQDLAATPAGRHTPAFRNYDGSRGVLSREFVSGPSGHELLRTAQFDADPRLRDRLAPAYQEIATYLTAAQTRLDLHPGNFIWNEARKRWVLVDLGPVPQIGSDYYNLKSFDVYLRDIWLRRLERMRTEPIRSLDWE